MAVSTKVDVKIPHKSGFDKSFQNLFTTKCGTLTPILCDEVIPGSVVDLDAAISASMPPLASDTFMRCDLKAEAFFVPNRLLYGGYEDWLTGNKVWDEDNQVFADVTSPVMLVTLGGANSAETKENRKYYEAGSLLDYLNFKIDTDSGLVNNNVKINPYPVLAYNRIYDDWYRNTQVQSPVFSRPINDYNLAATNVSALPYRIFKKPNNYTGTTSISIKTATGDGVKLGSLRQRNFGLDYFTTATPNPQMGDEQVVSFVTSASTGSFSISALRAANSLQQFAERNNLAGKRMQDYVKAHFGANLSSGVAQRAIYLGSASYNVYTKGVTATAGDFTVPTNNPFQSVGATYGKAVAAGNGKLIDHFEVAEPGIIMVLVSLVPKVTYASGIDRMFGRYINNGHHPSPTDMADPLLQNVGNQPIYQWELQGDKFYGTGWLDVFGYTDRYADFKSKFDQIHGLLRDGHSLESFALQRSLSGTPTISSPEFLPIPTDYLDQVTAVDNQISSYGVWVDSFLSYHVSMPLAEYSIPSLQDPAYEHGKDVSIDIRGSKL